MIRKQEFYEGAALHQLARCGGLECVHYEEPFFILNERLLVYLKYCTRSRSPWSFTFNVDEQVVLQKRPRPLPVTIGLVCGADGVVALSYDAYRSVAAPRQSAIHIACFRDYGHNYRVSGPDGRLPGTVAPSSWYRILDP